MAEAKQLSLAILAAGRSQRFGEQDKLTAALHGKMLGLHAAETLSPIPFANKFIITASTSHPCVSRWRELGYDVHANQKTDLGLATSVAMAANLAKNCAAPGLMICLADMPFVPQSHYQALVSQFDALDASNILSSTDGVTRSPPAIFGRPVFETLMALDGDGGARAMLKQHPALKLDPQFLADIDHPETLEKYQKMESHQ